MVFHKMHRTFKDHSKLWCFLQMVSTWRETNISQNLCPPLLSIRYWILFHSFSHLCWICRKQEVCFNYAYLKEIQYHNLLFLQSSSLVGQPNCFPVVACKDFRFIPIWNLYKLYIYEIWNANLAHHFIISYSIFCFLPNIRNMEHMVGWSWWTTISSLSGAKIILN